MGWKEPPQDRSLPCNPETLLFHRRRLGFSQAQLAERTGYSERVIVKAEGGNPIDAHTIEILAETFHDAAHPVTPEDLVALPVKMAQELIFGSYVHRGDVFQQIKHFLDEDVVLIFSGDPKEVPFAGTHSGIHAVEKALATFFQVLEAPDDCPYRDSHHFVVNQSDPQEVVVWGTSYFHPKGMPLSPLDLQIKMNFRRGKLYLIDDRFNSGKAGRMFGQSEPDADPS